MFPTTTSDDFLQAVVNPWFQALKNPIDAQNQVLQNLMEHYRKTEYGNRHSIDDVKSITDFQLCLPKINYEKLQPYLKEIKEGNYRAITPTGGHHFTDQFVPLGTHIYKITSPEKIEIPEETHTARMARIDQWLSRHEEDPRTISLQITSPTTSPTYTTSNSTITLGGTIATYDKWLILRGRVIEQILGGD